ncbi:hypothetical protein [Tepidanaerobacter syntrophicus]|uniref:Uncharacterized protein n=1 Tax=Tepidanaerobacter syntrophicus TaxID=224999 RepID=A0A0U9HC54_9FIRM|nr:hypothetical protein [Tepidanaerobacter syntrophicus]GAQ24221.1 hypothetical protein TSYNT_547 [Tepidanaerobacter syntrophicus]
MITPVYLVEELKNLAEKVVKNYFLETKKENFRKPPQVVTGYLPPKQPRYKGDSDDEILDFPFVIVRLVKGTDAQQSATAVVKFIIGTYSEETTEGWKDVASIIERIRQELCKKYIIGKRYQLEKPIQWEMPEEQPFPQWIGIMTTTWVVAQVIPEVDLFEEG